MLAAIWALLSGRPGWAGIAAGLLVLTRPSAQLIVPLVALVLWRQVGLRRAAGFAAVAVIVVTPWVIRNESIFHRPVIVTSNGFNLAAIYSPVALKAGQFVDPVFDKRFASVRNFGHSYVNLNEANLDSAFRREGLKGIREHPGQVPSVIWLNTRRLVDETWSLNDGPETPGRPPDRAAARDASAGLAGRDRRPGRPHPDGPPSQARLPRTPARGRAAGPRRDPADRPVLLPGVDPHRLGAAATRTHRRACSSSPSASSPISSGTQPT